MSVDAEPGEPAPEDRIEQVASEFGDAIAALPSYRRFLETKRAVEADEDAQERVAHFESVREQFLRKRQEGTADQSDLAELQSAQEQLHDLPVMEEFLAAQETLEGRLAELNDLVSADLAVDFGEKAGGCCED